MKKIIKIIYAGRDNETKALFMKALEQSFAYILEQDLIVWAQDDIEVADYIRENRYAVVICEGFHISVEPSVRVPEWKKINSDLKCYAFYESGFDYQKSYFKRIKKSVREGILCYNDKDFKNLLSMAINGNPAWSDMMSSYTNRFVKEGETTLYLTRLDRIILSKYVNIKTDKNVREIAQELNITCDTIHNLFKRLRHYFGIKHSKTLALLLYSYRDDKTFFDTESSEVTCLRA